MAHVYRHKANIGELSDGRLADSHFWWFEAPSWRYSAWPHDMPSGIELVSLPVQHASLSATEIVDHVDPNIQKHLCLLCWTQHAPQRLGHKKSALFSCSLVGTCREGHVRNMLLMVRSSLFAPRALWQLLSLGQIIIVSFEFEWSWNDTYWSLETFINIWLAPAKCQQLANLLGLHLPHLSMRGQQFGTIGVLRRANNTTACSTVDTCPN